MATTALQIRVPVTFTVENWAKIIAAVASSRLELTEKEELNSAIYECVTRQDRP